MAHVTNKPPANGFYWYIPRDENEEETIVKIQGTSVWFFGTEIDYEFGTRETEGTYIPIQKPELKESEIPDSLQILQETGLLEDLMDPHGNCRECNQHGRREPQIHHANCPVGRLVSGDLWVRLVHTRQNSKGGTFGPR